MRKLLIFTVAMLAGSVGSFAQYGDHRNRQVDSLEQVLATNPPTGGDLALLYRRLSFGYQETNIEKSMEYARKTIETATPLRRWRTVADGYYNIGIGYHNLSRYDSALVNYNKTLEAIEMMREHPANTELIIEGDLASTYGQIANLYNAQGMYHEAIDYYTRALSIFEKHGWPEHLTIAYSQIGAMYISMGNWDQAENNFVKADSLAHTSRDSLMIAFAKGSLGRVYLHKGEYDRALANASIARDYYFAHPEEEGISRAETLNLLAEIYFAGYNDEAQTEMYARQALMLAEELEIPLEKAAALTTLSSLHLSRGEWRAAERTALDALAADDSEPANTLSLYGILAQVYARLGDADRSVLYFNRHDSLQSSWATRHYQSAIRDMEVKYETEKKEARIATLEDERRLMVLLSIAAGAVLLLAMATLFFLWRWSVGRRRIVATQALLDGETAERVRLARDLHDGLGSMLTGIRLSLENLQGTAGADVAPSLDMLRESTQELRRISHHLMPNALESEGLKPALATFCRSLPAVQFGWFGSDERVEAQMEVVIYRIVYELVNNALKHSGASQIGVQVMRETDYIAFTVRDNGCGFDTAEAESRGMGLRNIRDRVASGGGRILVDSRPGEGTEINVNFKVK